MNHHVEVRREGVVSISGDFSSWEVRQAAAHMCAVSVCAAHHGCEGTSCPLALTASPRLSEMAGLTKVCLTLPDDFESLRS
eukprot:CAMPEP_0119409984 /NCGR_PEP_ID=MMETSP1335-20130426/3132_1 /TAXON_ID=259385 /ORGANISM="Chrysoculter rhomboideus, Strain RCC1486" /LENGTH=80 /DNA_ID=CAMNT_0007434445 /DNA_START=236 /DNA_END=478 /DNA_ORIENTATION=+